MDKNIGAIVIIYKIEEGIYYYLLPTQTSGIVNIIGGGSKPEDKDSEANIRREIAEETSLRDNDYELKETSLIHGFTYGENKPERAGKSWRNEVFIARVSPEVKIEPSNEIESLDWYNADEAIKILSFNDMKEIFEKSVKIVEGK